MENDLATPPIFSESAPAATTGKIIPPDNPVTPPPPVHINSKKKLIIVLFVSLIIIAVSLFSTFLFINRNSDSVSPTPSSPSGAEQVSNNNLWKNYVDNKNGFLIKYPAEEYSKKDGTLFYIYSKDYNPETGGELAPNISLGHVYNLEETTTELSFWINTRGDLFANIENTEEKSFGDNKYLVVTQKNDNSVSKNHLIKKGNKIVDITLVFPDTTETEVNQKLENILAIMLPTFKWTTPVDFSKWSNWNDPYDFSLSYPPRGEIQTVQGVTRLSVKSDAGNYAIEFCPNCRKDACEGVCDKKKDIEVAIGETKYQETQIWPNNNGDYTLRAVIKYPNTHTDKVLTVYAYYPAEILIDEINEILKTFKWGENAKKLF